MKRYFALLLILPFLGGCLATKTEIRSLDSRLSAVQTRVSLVEDKIAHKVIVGKDRVPSGNIVISGGTIVIHE